MAASYKKLWKLLTAKIYKRKLWLSILRLADIADLIRLAFVSTQYIDNFTKGAYHG